MTPVAQMTALPIAAAAAEVDTGDTAWMLAATALVLMMTPALGLFYAGLVRAKNTLNTFMMCVAAIAVATVDLGAGRLLARLRRQRRPDRRPRLRRPATTSTFEPARRDDDPAPALHGLPGDLLHHHRRARLRRGGRADALRRRSWSSPRSGRCSSTRCSPTGPSAAAGWPRGGTLDFAGGVPVEMGSGFSALAAALVVGARKDYGRQALLPHNAVYVLLGAGLLWFGWFGFNGGSGFSTGNPSVLAFTNTLLTPACTLVVWFVLDLIRGRQGDRDRRRDRDHRRLRADHPGGRLRQPRLGDGARRARRAALLRGDRLAAAHPGRRDARRARRPRRRRLHRHPLHRLLRPARLERRLRRPLLRQRRPARRPGAGGARRARSTPSASPSCCCG